MSTAHTLSYTEPRRLSAGDDEGVATFGIAIATIGRWDELQRLLGDLARQSHPPHTVAIAYDCDDDADDGLRRAIAPCEGKIKVRTVRKSGGCTERLNAAAALFTDEVEWILFPSDTNRFYADVLQRLAVRCVAPATTCVLQLVDAEGVRRRLPAPGTKLTRRNVWHATAIAVRNRDFLRVGGFDPQLGSGAETPWQSGDETDLLIRLSMLHDFSIEWIDDVSIHTQTDFSHLPPRERRRKLRGYGRGTGYLYRRYDYSIWSKLRILLGAATTSLRKPSKYRAGDGLMLFIGRLEGLLGRKFSRDADHRAVLR